MTWTYSGDPSSSEKDAIRFKLGDIISTDPILQDEEINYTISTNSSIDDAAYAACVSIVAKFSRLADKTVGKVKIYYSQRVAHYQALADTLWLNAGIVITPYAGGTSVADKAAMESDNSIVQPAFKKGMMDNHRYI
ncbi:hypothetical protein [Pectinatus frisingensis]|uniref:hypothetical protein n=1 Tax=Pectinatus frisingensis TaxID=865 RepID=UPI0018C7CF9B|nr:hypothetical protein [Pectinatus frisingensis]